MRVSFDFDCTLGESYRQSLAQVLIKGGCEVFCITARNIGMSHNQDLYKVIDRVVFYEKI